KYLPPYIREKAATLCASEYDKVKSEQQIRLQRQLQGLLNRFKYTTVNNSANFIQVLVEEFEVFHGQFNKSIDTKDIDGNGGKECTNLIVLISELYNFRVVSCTLIYDIIRLFIMNLTDLNVELLLKIVK
ncbi:7889_t:CDS:2, partial [Racocetra persica]